MTCTQKPHGLGSDMHLILASDARSVPGCEMVVLHRELRLVSTEKRGRFLAALLMLKMIRRGKERKERQAKKGNEAKGFLRLFPWSFWSYGLVYRGFRYKWSSFSNSFSLRKFEYNNMNMNTVKNLANFFIANIEKKKNIVGTKDQFL